LNELRLRLKQSGKKKETAKVAALQSYLREDKSRKSWPMIGLVQAIFLRSLSVGFEMMEASIDVSGPDAGEGKDLSLTDRLSRSQIPRRGGSHAPESQAWEPAPL